MVPGLVRMVPVLECQGRTVLAVAETAVADTAVAGTSRRTLLVSPA